MSTEESPFPAVCIIKSSTSRFFPVGARLHVSRQPGKRKKKQTAKVTLQVEWEGKATLSLLEKKPEEGGGDAFRLRARFDVGTESFELAATADPDPDGGRTAVYGCVFQRRRGRSATGVWVGEDERRSRPARS